MKYTTIMRRTFFFLLLTCWSVMLSARQKPVVVAYVVSSQQSVSDPTLMTHINYAFGRVNETFDGVIVDNPENLHKIVSQKKQNPKLRVSLSIGGWGAGRFSEMAADEKLRESFAKDCRRVVDEFGLDGIDIDWEFPTVDWANISCRPDDTENYTLMMRDIRKAIGKKKDLTLATMGSAQYIDFPAILPYITFVNIMAYDMNRVPLHHSALHKSSINTGFSCEDAIDTHLNKGIPANKLVLGMPFYGHGTAMYADYVTFPDARPLDNSIEEKWDEEACVPYLVDSEGNVVLCFDNVRSITLKCKYIKERKIRGGMYWHFHYDNATHDLGRTVAKEILGHK